MKVRIDVLKAPWPEGANVGDVVEVQDITPAFVGKCAQVGNDVEATVAFALPEPDADPLAALKAEAKEHGIKVDGRWSAERLAEEVEKAKKVKAGE